VARLHSLPKVLDMVSAPCCCAVRAAIVHSFDEERSGFLGRRAFVKNAKRHWWPPPKAGMTSVFKEKASDRSGCRLTLRWSGRVRDKVPSSYVGARAAQLNRYAAEA
jgi:hypothetical protein